MNDVLVVLDAFNDFEHDGGDRLLESFRARVRALRVALESARAAGTAVVYVNDRGGSWSGDRAELLARATGGRGGDLVAKLLPRPEEPLLLKSRYSAFDHTELELILGELAAERLVLVGASTEGCVVQTGIDARELRFKVTILTSACATADPEREQVALRYANEVAGIRLETTSLGSTRRCPRMRPGTRFAESRRRRDHPSCSAQPASGTLSNAGADESRWRRARGLRT